MNKDLKLHPDPEINKEVNADLREAQEADRKAGLPDQIQKCVTCDSTGFSKSALGPDRCTFCDGTEGGNAPTEADYDPALLAPAMTVAKYTITGLSRRIKQLEVTCDSFESNSKEASEVFEVLLAAGKVPTEKPGPTLSSIVMGILNEIEDIKTRSILRSKEHDALILENRKLFELIKEHHDQQGDDRCHLDDQKLYTGAGLMAVETALPEAPVFIGNCVRYWLSRQTPGQTYITVEDRIKKAVLQKGIQWKKTEKKMKRVVKVAIGLADAVRSYHRNKKGGSRDLVEHAERVTKWLEAE